MNTISEKILDHYRNPRNAGELEDANASGQVENEACGDSMQLFARIEDGKIVQASCKTFGCAPAVAAGSVLTELLSEKALNEVGEFSPAYIEEALGGLPPMKRHAAQLAADVAVILVKNYKAEISH
tara:strand:- start:158 stop:535 length:378 start_codon:yes stop_codon:yes gene_type:complete